MATEKAGDFKEYLFKVLVVGDIGSGKSSIIKRFVHNVFSIHYKATIGVDFASKVINWDSESVVRLQLWDIAGQERFGNMTRVYYKEAVGAFIVYDVTRNNTFEAVQKWKADIDAKVTLPDGSPVPVILLGNKSDLMKDGSGLRSNQQMERFCEEHGFQGWFHTSAKENINIDKSVRALVAKILENDHSNTAAEAQNFVTLGEVGTKKASCC
eukprot:Colp12_sorted_trinity150504_noHs@10134